MTPEERFWAKVDKTGECWVWTGGKRGLGYGSFHVTVDGRYTTIAAHRLSWEWANGPIPADTFVLHHCDVPACVRPAHLWLGTHADNMRDRESKGRGRKGIRSPIPHGTRNGYVRHLRYGEDACQACLDANSARTAAIKARR